MSNLGQFRSGPQPGLPTPPRGETIARYATYAEAQHAVDHLSDQHFPVQMVTIVGSDLRMVERVTGRLTYGRVALAGILSGAWFGIFVGLLLAIFGGDAYTGLAAVVGAAFIGAAFGMLFGVMSYAFTGGRRDFTSSSQIVASEYQVLCAEEQAGQARELLRRLPGGTGGPGAGGGGGGLAAPATVTPAPPAAAGSAAPPVGELPAVTPAGAAPPAEPAAPAVPATGPTYGEMVERQRREQREREHQEQVERIRREQAERAAEQATAERRAAEREAAQGEADGQSAR